MALPSGHARRLSDDAAAATSLIGLSVAAAREATDDGSKQRDHPSPEAGRGVNVSPILRATPTAAPVPAAAEAGTSSEHSGPATTARSSPGGPTMRARSGAARGSPRVAGRKSRRGRGPGRPNHGHGARPYAVRRNAGPGRSSPLLRGSLQSPGRGSAVDLGRSHGSPGGVPATRSPQQRPEAAGRATTAGGAPLMRRMVRDDDDDDDDVGDDGRSHASHGSGAESGGSAGGSAGDEDDGNISPNAHDARERNRIHARKSRQRRKHRMNNMQDELQSLEAEKSELQAQLQDKHGILWHSLASQQALLAQARDLEASLKHAAAQVSKNTLSVQPKDRSKPTNATERLARIRERNRINARKARQRRRIKLDELHGTVELLKHQVSDLQEWIDLPTDSPRVRAARHGGVSGAHGMRSRGRLPNEPRVDTAAHRRQAKRPTRTVAGSGGSPGSGQAPCLTGTPTSAAGSPSKAMAAPRHPHARGLASLSDPSLGANASHSLLAVGARAAGGSHLTPRESRRAFPAPASRATSAGSPPQSATAQVATVAAETQALGPASGTPANSPMSTDEALRKLAGGPSAAAASTSVSAAAHQWPARAFEAGPTTTTPSSPGQHMRPPSWTLDMMFPTGSPRQGMTPMATGPSFPAMLAAWGGMNGMPAAFSPRMFGSMPVSAGGRFGMPVGAFGWDAGVNNIPPHLSMVYALGLAQARMGLSSGQAYMAQQSPASAATSERGAKRSAPGAQPGGGQGRLKKKREG